MVIIKQKTTLKQYRNNQGREQVLYLRLRGSMEKKRNLEQQPTHPTPPISKLGESQTWLEEVRLWPIK